MNNVTIINLGVRVRTQGGLLGTVINMTTTNWSTVCEVKLDCGGLMHYNVESLIKV